MRISRIRLVSVQPPESVNVNTELQWLGRSLGLFGDRDKEKSCYRVFIALVTNREHVLTSDQIAAVTSLTRGTVVHHLNKLRDSGLIEHTAAGYRLRAQSMQQAVQDLRKEVNDLLDSIEHIAQDIDKRMR